MMWPAQDATQRSTKTSQLESKIKDRNGNGLVVEKSGMSMDILGWRWGMGVRAIFAY